jgi:hypothetical protein
VLQGPRLQAFSLQPPDPPAQDGLGRLQGAVPTGTGSSLGSGTGTWSGSGFGIAMRSVSGVSRPILAPLSEVHDTVVSTQKDLAGIALGGAASLYIPSYRMSTLTRYQPPPKLHQDQ